jgi:hypothetical protein
MRCTTFKFGHRSTPGMKNPKLDVLTDRLKMRFAERTLLRRGSWEQDYTSPSTESAIFGEDCEECTL